MATHSSVLAWIIPGTGEPGGLPSMGSHRIGQDWSGLAVAVAAKQERNPNVTLKMIIKSQGNRAKEERNKKQLHKKPKHSVQNSNNSVIIISNWTSLIAQVVKNLSAMQEMLVWFLSWENLLERDRLLAPVFLASLVAQVVKNLPAIRQTWVWSLGWEDPQRRESLPTLVFWPGEFQGLYSLWGSKESGLSDFH